MRGPPLVDGTYRQILHIVDHEEDYVRAVHSLDLLGVGDRSRHTGYVPGLVHGGVDVIGRLRRHGDVREDAAQEQRPGVVLDGEHSQAGG